MTPTGFMAIAHRGASSYAPENTFAAFDLAIEMGARHLELDVHFSSDGHLVVIHDDTVDRTTDGSGPVTSRSLAALTALDAGAWFDPRFKGERIPTLGAVLEKVFQNPEFKADFRCFMHPWMVAYVHVMEHPFYAVTGPDGTFTLKGLPPGDYEIAAMHESSRFEVAPERVTVSVKAGETKSIEFVYRDPK